MADLLYERPGEVRVDIETASLAEWAYVHEVIQKRAERAIRAGVLNPFIRCTPAPSERMLLIQVLGKTMCAWFDEQQRRDALRDSYEVPPGPSRAP